MNNMTQTEVSIIGIDIDIRPFVNRAMGVRSRENPYGIRNSSRDNLFSQCIKCSRRVAYENQRCPNDVEHCVRHQKHTY